MFKILLTVFIAATHTPTAVGIVDTPFPDKASCQRKADEKAILGGIKATTELGFPVIVEARCLPAADADEAFRKVHDRVTGQRDS